MESAASQSIGRAKRLAVFTVLPACVTAATVWALLDITQQSPAVPRSSSVTQGGTVQLVGQVVAISPQSITTRQTDGTTTTFAITSTTAQISTDGSANPGTGPLFSVNETITVLGVMNNGIPVATALADQNAGNGPPMDAV